jgi:hypothetical protein
VTAGISGPNFKDLQLKTDWSESVGDHKLFFLKRFLLALNRDFQEWMTNLNSWNVALLRHLHALLQWLKPPDWCSSRLNINYDITF